MTKDKYTIKELEAKIKETEAYTGESTVDWIVDDTSIHYYNDLGYIKGLKCALNLIKDCKLPYIDENAETLNDKLRMEHTPVPEEREDASLFETMAEKFRPKA